VLSVVANAPTKVNISIINFNNQYIPENGKMKQFIITTNVCPFNNP
jgi:hypothetical protein